MIYKMLRLWCGWAQDKLFHNVKTEYTLILMFNIHYFLCNMHIDFDDLERVGTDGADRRGVYAEHAFCPSKHSKQPYHCYLSHNKEMELIYENIIRPKERKAKIKTE